MVSHLVSLQKEIYIARAPGRLDVMGGIADYSGSLVLQVCSIAGETGFCDISMPLLNM